MDLALLLKQWDVPLKATLCFSSINLMFISNYTVFFMQMTARLFIIMHINSRLYAYLFLS